MSGWISVKDRLPQAGNEFILIANDEAVLPVVVFDGKYVSVNHDVIDEETVTHWRPLPEPPNPT